MGIARILISRGGGQFEMQAEQNLPYFRNMITGNFFADPQLVGAGPVADLLAWSANDLYWYRLARNMKFERVDRDTLTFQTGRVQVAGNFSDRRFDDVFFLDEYQNVSFLGTTGAGDFARLIPEPYVSQVSLARDNIAYSRVAKGKFTASAYDSLFLYSPVDRSAAVYATDGHGIPVRINSPLRANRFPVVQNDYRSVIAGRFVENPSGYDWDDILLYRAATGRASLCTTDGFADQQSTGLVERETLNLGANVGNFWRPGNFTGNTFTDLAIYNDETGMLTVYTKNGSGRMSPAGPGIHVGPGYDLVQPGRFSEGQLTDLLLYKR